MKQYRLTAVIWKEGRRFVSKCPELGISSFGATPEKARKAIQEAAELYLENATRLGLMKELTPMLSSPVHYTTPLEVRAA
jgi:predicted RNase H-like HicB family nuclease